MIISFVRHGESLSNTQGIFSSDISYKNGLTQTGRGQIENTARTLSGHISGVYASPFIRTVESAEIFIKTRSEKLTLVVDDRLREIDYGKQSSKKNSPEMVEVSRRQIAGDYEIRFGETGENKREIITRFYGFIMSLMSRYKETDHIVVFSHGRAISILEAEINMLRGVDYSHASTNNGELRQIEFKTIRDMPLIHDALCDLESNRRVSLVEERYELFVGINNDIQQLNKDRLLDIAENGVDDDELSYDILDYFTYGLYVSPIEPVCLKIDKDALSTRDVIIICSLKDAEILIEPFIEHHKKIGISHFVFIDNNSSDGSADIIQRHDSSGIKIDLWSTDDIFDGFKAMGWKQRLMSYYGEPHWFMNLDIDEFFAYVDMEKLPIGKLTDCLNKENLKVARAIMLDMYPNRPLLSSPPLRTNPSPLSDYKYIDKGTYCRTSSDKFKYRFFGGPRARAFDLRSSLQKYPLLYIEAGTLGINPHFWYPYKVNLNTKQMVALLHYKFLPGDFEKYQVYAKTGIHWDNSREYRSYIGVINDSPSLNLYDERYSIEYINSHTLSDVTIKDVVSERHYHIF